MTILLDGGMGQELVRRGYDSPVIWAARALMEAPEVVREVHEAFIDAGAEVITTNTYSTVPKILARVEQQHRFPELVALARDLAVEAKQREPRTKVAGSLPPLGSSYQPDKVDRVEDMRPIYDEMVGLLVPGVDMFICETMTNAAQARAAAEAAAATGKPVWVSWTIQDSGSSHLRSGETIQQALSALDGVAVEAALFNCCSPEAISAAIPELRRATALKVGGYANAFRPIPDDYRRDRDGRRGLREDVTPEGYAKAACDWLAHGADIVGGCCGTGPDHIRQLRRAIDA